MIPPEEWRGGECIMRANWDRIKETLEPIMEKKILLVLSKALKWNLFLMLLLVKWN